MKSLRLGALDLGTNAVRLRLAVVEAGRVVTVADEREAVRPGEGVFATGRLSLAAMDRVAAAVGRLAGRAHAFHTHAFRAVATAAVREAHNREEFVRRIARETGVTLEVLSGEEEARLAALGVIADPALCRQDHLSCDLGGGSTELVLVRGGRVERCWSLALGAVRDAERFLGRDDPPSPLAVARLRLHAREELLTLDRAALPAGLPLVGCGGTVRAIAAILGALGVARSGVGRDELASLLSGLARLSARGRASLPGMDPDRADVVVAGVALLLEVLLRLRVDRVLPTTLGLRDGLVIDLARRLAGAIGLEGR